MPLGLKNIHVASSGLLVEQHEDIPFALCKVVKINISEAEIGGDGFCCYFVDYVEIIKT